MLANAPLLIIVIKYSQASGQYASYAPLYTNDKI